MATFYLLPPRACLERAVADLFGKLLPGLPLPAEAWDELTRALATAGAWPDDVFLVPKDELPEGDATAALAECCGAEAGDRVVSVSLTQPARAWEVPSDVSGLVGAR